MNQFVVSARKYRPASFDTVVGQLSIAVTLKNAIKKNMLAHAYLFFGPRGVGKTTCARIFAKTINCQHPDENMEACNQCESCLSFNENRSFNIHELDAASNNSVEDIRNLIDQVRIPPQVGKYSTYIIDEVHMLSLNAFNAFLKTLEEPPKHAIFILATTEKHKIIPTILSRCQIFDFNRIEISDIVGHLSKIALNEGVKADPEALTIIAQKADGAMRDALSIYDQIVSFSDNDITYEKVIQNLNVLDYEYYFKIVDAFLQGDYASNLILFDEIVRKGFDGNHFLNGLARHFRDLLVCKEPSTVKLLEVGASIKEKYLRQANQAPTSFIFDALEICNQFDINYKNSKNQKLHVELALLQLTNLVLKKKGPEESINLAPTKGEISLEATASAPAKPELTKETIAPNSANPEQLQKQDVSSASTQELQKPPISAAFTQELPSLSKAPLSSENTTASPSLELKPKAVVPPKPKTQDSLNLDSILKEVESAKTAKPEKVEKVIEPETPSESDNYPERNLLDSELKSAWTAYLEKLKLDEPRLYSSLSANYPILKPENQLILEVANESLLEVMNLKKSGILHFLKDELKIRSIALDIQLQVYDESKVKAYTSNEKLQVLIQKNPHLAEFKTALGLDFD